MSVFFFRLKIEEVVEITPEAVEPLSLRILVYFVGFRRRRLCIRTDLSDSDRRP